MAEAIFFLLFFFFPAFGVAFVILSLVKFGFLKLTKTIPNANNKIRLQRILVLAAVLIACLELNFLNDMVTPARATEEQKKRAMQHLTFDKAVISKLAQYEKLRTFLGKNSAIIIKYRDSLYLDEISKIRKEGKWNPRVNYRDCYGFSPYYPDYFPKEIRLKISEMLSVVGEDYFRDFTICRNKNITIGIKSDGGENRLYSSHTLLWNPEFKQEYYYVGHKDTLIAKDCIYRITVTEHPDLD